MATCTQCGAELKPGAKFCENNGSIGAVPLDSLGKYHGQNNGI